MSCTDLSRTDPSCVPPPRPTAGFTLVEMLVAAAVAMTIFGILLNLLVGTGQVQAREQLQISVDESMRAALELMSMDLRESVGPRVVLAGAPGLPAGLAGYASGSSAFTATRIPPSAIMYVQPPGGYPGTRMFSGVTSTALVAPNAAGLTCSNLYSGGDYALLVADAVSSWVKVDASPCSGSSGSPTLQHSGTALSYGYTPSTFMGRVDATRYAIQTVNGLSALTRQLAGSPVQVVAYDITALQVEYSADGANFSAVPVAPKAIRLTLTGQRSSASKSSSLTLSTTVFMRDVAVPAPIN